MAKKLRGVQKLRLSPLASRVMKLVDIVGEGSQRSFAAKVGCSQALISKIATGQQEPGPALIKRILEIKGMEKEWLHEGAGQPPVPAPEDNYYVPIADALLPGPPAEHGSLLSSRSEPVPQALYSNSIYVVPARRCGPAFGDREEQLRANDLILIDAAEDRWKRNLDVVDGKLCVLHLPEVNDEVITLARVRLVYDQEEDIRTLKTVLERELKEYREEQEKARQALEQFGRELRAIDLETSDEAQDRKRFWSEIPVTSIVGVAIQLVRVL